MSIKSIDESAYDKDCYESLKRRGVSARRAKRVATAPLRSEAELLALRIHRPPFDIHAARKFGGERMDLREIVRAAVAAHGA